MEMIMEIEVGRVFNSRGELRSAGLLASGDLYLYT
jgi:hypothetical protein